MLIGNTYWNKAQLCFIIYYCNLIPKFQFHPPVQTVFWQNCNMAHQAPTLATPPTHWHSEVNSTKPDTHTSCLHRSVVPGTAMHVDAEKNLSIAYWCIEMEEGIGILLCLLCQVRLCRTSRSVGKIPLKWRTTLKTEVPTPILYSEHYADHKPFMLISISSTVYPLDSYFFWNKSGFFKINIFPSSVKYHTVGYNKTELP